MSALNQVARDLRITLIALFARADGLVVLHATGGVGAAIARIATLPVDAGVAVAAIIICGTRADYRQLY